MTRCAVWGMRRTRSPVRGARPAVIVCGHPVRSGAEIAPSPRTCTARRESSAAAAVSAPTNASIIPWLSELRRDGRFSTTRSTAPSRCAVTEPSVPAASTSCVTLDPHLSRSCTVAHTVGYTITILYKLAIKGRRTRGADTAPRTRGAQEGSANTDGHRDRRRPPVRRAAAAADHRGGRGDAASHRPAAVDGAPAPDRGSHARAVRRLGTRACRR